MEFICEKKYIVLPASFNAQKKRLYFYIGNRLVYDLEVSLEYNEPDFCFPVNLERFMGEKIRLECDCNIDIKLECTDSPVLDYSGKYRPLVHFTSKRGWLNDPNGLTYYKGSYLMFYQHNPAATTWGNMHWGYARSTDLVHWEEIGDVLFPDSQGTIFSGGGLVDRNNVAGLKSGEDDTILLFYTSAGNTSAASAGSTFTQRLAYSTDGGRSFVKYDRPLLEELCFENRDPKVIYFEPDKCFIMVLFLMENEFAFFKSYDLLHWTEFQRLCMEEDWECPDFYPLPVDGDNENVKWVFTAAYDRYLIGSFDGKCFTPEHKGGRLHYGDASYAAQSWSDVPDVRRIRTAFAKIVVPGMPFGCCMNIPQVMSLKNINGELKLCAEPVEELKGLIVNETEYNDYAVSDGAEHVHRVNSRACDVKLTVSINKDFSIELFGQKTVYDSRSGMLSCGECRAPVKGINGKLELRIIYDTVYTELFTEGGSVFMGVSYIQDTSLNRLTVKTEDNHIEKLYIAELEAFY